MAAYALRGLMTTMNLPNEICGHRPADSGLSLAALPSNEGLHRIRWPSVSGNQGPDDFDMRIDGSGLAIQFEARDVGVATIQLVEDQVEELAQAYIRIAPDELLRSIRVTLHKIGYLLGKQVSALHRRRLLIAGGWTALLAATVYLDLGNRDAAQVLRNLAASLARESEHNELNAWVFEIDTWAALLDGDWPRAVTLAAAGESIAPARSFAAVQLAAQSARAAARLGDGVGVRNALSRARSNQRQSETGVSRHFNFDAKKLHLYAATALAWLKDPAAGDYAYEAAACYEAGSEPRRLSTAYFDLSMIWSRLGRPDEAERYQAFARQAEKSFRVTSK